MCLIKSSKPLVRLFTDQHEYQVCDHKKNPWSLLPSNSPANKVNWRDNLMGKSTCYTGLRSDPALTSETRITCGHICNLSNQQVEDRRSTGTFQLPAQLWVLSQMNKMETNRGHLRVYSAQALLKTCVYITHMCAHTHTPLTQLHINRKQKKSQQMIHPLYCRVQETYKAKATAICHSK